MLQDSSRQARHGRRQTEKISPAVVNITFSQQERDAFGRIQQAEGTGSGFIIDDQGHVVTNYHVAGGANRFAAAWFADHHFSNYCRCASPLMLVARPP